MRWVLPTPASPLTTTNCGSPVSARRTASSSTASCSRRPMRPRAPPFGPCCCGFAVAIWSRSCAGYPLPASRAPTYPSCTPCLPSRLRAAERVHDEAIHAARDDHQVAAAHPPVVRRLAGQPVGGRAEPAIIQPHVRRALGHLEAYRCVRGPGDMEVLDGAEPDGAQPVRPPHSKPAPRNPTVERHRTDSHRGKIRSHV